VLSSTANSQLQSQHKYNQQQYDSTGENKQETTKKKHKKQRKMYPFWLLSLHTAFVVEIHLA
jgi:hypothetical protein